MNFNNKYLSLRGRAMLFSAGSFRFMQKTCLNKFNFIDFGSEDPKLNYLKESSH